MLMHPYKFLQIMNSSLVYKGVKLPVNLMAEEATTAAFILDLKNVIEDTPTAVIPGVPKALVSGSQQSTTKLHFKKTTDIIYPW